MAHYHLTTSYVYRIFSLISIEFFFVSNKTCKHFIMIMVENLKQYKNMNIL